MKNLGHTNETDRITTTGKCTLNSFIQKKNGYSFDLLMLETVLYKKGMFTYLFNSNVLIKKEE